MPQVSLKKIGLTILFVPLGFLSLFLVGETLTGDWSGFGHLFQLVPLVLLILLAWKKPLWAGILLVTLSLLFGGWYVLDGSEQMQTIVLVELILFTPLLVSGILLILSSSARRANV